MGLFGWLKKRKEQKAMRDADCKLLNSQFEFAIREFNDLLIRELVYKFPY